MDFDLQVQSLDGDALTPVARQALADPTAVVQSWRCVPLGWVPMDKGRILYRFEGTAETTAGERSWSAVLKRLPPTKVDESHWNWYVREVHFYQSDLPSTLPRCHLRPPRCYGVERQADGADWLWLEEIREAHPEWRPDRYALAARHLGEMNGAYAAGTPMPDHPWLSRQWLRKWADLGATGEGNLRNPAIWEHETNRRMFPEPIADRALRLLAEYRHWLDLMERMPQALCHMDAWRGNLLAARTPDGRDETVALDWSFVGPGALGQDAGCLFGGSLFWMHVHPDDIAAVKEGIYEGYLTGLRAAGWDGSVVLARFGFTASAALQWAMALGIWSGHLTKEGTLDFLQRKTGKSADEIIFGWGRSFAAAHDMADEARTLVPYVEQALRQGIV